MQPKFRIGQTVKLNGKQSYIIKGIEKHGNTICGCCYGDVYFLYNITSNLWVNESELDPALAN